MANTLTLRDTRAADTPQIETIYAQAFPDEDLLPLVGELLTMQTGVLSLAATRGGTLLGHVAFTLASVEDYAAPLAMLAPLAVTPQHQRMGIGQALVREGLRRLKDRGVVEIYVLDDPDYYSRLGFTPNTRVSPPYPLSAPWRHAWQSLSLQDTTLPCGALLLPPLWHQPALWTPP